MSRPLHNGIDYRPLQANTWSDFEQVMGACQGGNSGCWCTWWRLPHAQWHALGCTGRKAQMQALAAAEVPIGVIGYTAGEAYGWCAIAPVADTPRVVASPFIRPSPQAWFISCFFIRAGYRRRGHMRDLLQAALAYARDQGAQVVEACPRAPSARVDSGDLFIGVATPFLAAGFREVHRLRPERPLLRLELGHAPPTPSAPKQLD